MECEATMDGMQRHTPRGYSARRAPAVLRWIAADARDVARIEIGGSGPRPAVRSVARGVVRWRRRIEQRRLLALALRSLLVGAGLACLAQLAGLASRHADSAVWLVPGLLGILACLAVGLAHRTSDQTAARMLDRDLGLGARVSTAFELEGEGAAEDGSCALRGLALADGRVALSRSLARGRVRLASRHAEPAALVALVAALALLVILPAAGTSGRPGGVVRASGQPSTSGARAGGRPATPHVGAGLQGYRQQTVPVPSLAQVTASSTRRAGTVSGHSPYGGGTANSSNGDSFYPVSRTLGPASTKQGTHAASNAQTTTEGTAERGAGAAGSQRGGTHGTASSQGAIQGVSPNAGGQASAGATPRTGAGGKSRKTGGSSRGGAGSSTPGTSQGAGSRHSAPGGATAGATRGARSSGTGIVPQLGAGATLPLQPGYQPVSGAQGPRTERAAATAGGGGGSSHSGRATATSATGGSGRGVPFVPPGGTAVASADRDLLLGYFGSFSRVTSSGW
jgi:hypothetical protein